MIAVAIVHYQIYLPFHWVIMAINNSLSPLTPHEAAEAVGVGVQSIRRWCEWHGVHLSAGASPGPGIPRRLTLRDVEVLITVKDLRYQGLQTEAINERLRSTAFPEIDDSPSDNPSMDSSEVTIAQPTSPEPHSEAPLMLAVVNDLQTQIRALQQARDEDKRIRQSQTLIFLLGLTAGIVLMGVAIVALLLMR